MILRIWMKIMNYQLRNLIYEKIKQHGNITDAELMKLTKDDVDITEPPTIVNNMKNNDKTKFGEQFVIPDVEIDDVIAKNTLAKT